jgi:hypothetical protein
MPNLTIPLFFLRSQQFGLPRPCLLLHSLPYLIAVQTRRLFRLYSISRESEWSRLNDNLQEDIGKAYETHSWWTDPQHNGFYCTFAIIFWTYVEVLTATASIWKATVNIRSYDATDASSYPWVTARALIKHKLSNQEPGWGQIKATFCSFWLLHDISPMTKVSSCWRRQAGMNQNSRSSKHDTSWRSFGAV